MEAADTSDAVCEGNDEKFPPRLASAFAALAGERRALPTVGSCSRPGARHCHVPWRALFLRTKVEPTGEFVSRKKPQKPDRG
jgi:hypothetical protein